MLQEHIKIKLPNLHVLNVQLVNLRQLQLNQLVNLVLLVPMLMRMVLSHVLHVLLVHLNRPTVPPHVSLVLLVQLVVFQVCLFALPVPLVMLRMCLVAHLALPALRLNSKLVLVLCNVIHVQLVVINHFKVNLNVLLLMQVFMPMVQVLNKIHVHQVHLAM